MGDFVEAGSGTAPATGRAGSGDLAKAPSPELFVAAHASPPAAPAQESAPDLAAAESLLEIASAAASSHGHSPPHTPPSDHAPSPPASGTTNTIPAAAAAAEPVLVAAQHNLPSPRANSSPVAAYQAAPIKHETQHTVVATQSAQAGSRHVAPFTGPDAPHVPPVVAQPPIQPPLDRNLHQQTSLQSPSAGSAANTSAGAAHVAPYSQGHAPVPSMAPAPYQYGAPKPGLPSMVPPPQPQPPSGQYPPGYGYPPDPYRPMMGPPPGSQRPPPAPSYYGGPPPPYPHSAYDAYYRSAPLPYQQAGSVRDSHGPGPIRTSDPYGAAAHSYGRPYPPMAPHPSQHQQPSPVPRPQQQLYMQQHQQHHHQQQQHMRAAPPPQHDSQGADTYNDPNSGAAMPLRTSCEACRSGRRGCDGNTPCSRCVLKRIPCVRAVRKKAGPKGSWEREAARNAVAAEANRALAEAAYMEAARSGWIKPEAAANAAQQRQTPSPSYPAHDSMQSPRSAPPLDPPMNYPQHGGFHPAWVENSNGSYASAGYPPSSDPRFAQAQHRSPNVSPWQAPAPSQFPGPASAPPAPSADRYFPPVDAAKSASETPTVAHAPVSWDPTSQVALGAAQPPSYGQSSQGAGVEATESRIGSGSVKVTAIDALLNGASKAE